MGSEDPGIASNLSAMPKCFLICTGLGHVTRGFESFARECFDTLKDHPRVEMHLFKGAGPDAERERALWTLRRASMPAKLLGSITGKGAYYIEQASFLVGLLRQIRRQKPDVVYFSDMAIGNALWHWRRKHQGTFKLLLSNGGPVSPPFPRFDHIQQVSPAHYQDAINAGETADRMTLLPYGFKLDPSTLPPAREERDSLRRRFNLPTDRPIALSVGALNVAHKRMDYLIREVAQLPPPRPYLLMLGQVEGETPQVLTVAEQALGSEGYAAKSVSPADVPLYCRAADVFALASVSEGFGRVFVEAASNGVPCLAHDYPVSRGVLGEFGRYADCNRPGALTRVLAQALSDPPTPAARMTQITAMYKQYSWANLADAYAEMLEKCHAGPIAP